MDLNSTPSLTSSGLAGQIPAYGTGEVPEGLSDIILRRGENEKIVWRGRPEFWRLAATAFHTNSIAVYFALLTIYSGVTEGLSNAITIASMGGIALLILYVLAYLYSKKSHYILTNERLLILSGIAIEKRISIPLSHLGAAHLKLRSAGFGSIALEISGPRQLGYLILWPHARPLRFNNPQPLIRVVPDAQNVAKLLAEVVGGRVAIEEHLTEINASTAAPVRKGQADIGSGKGDPLADGNLKGATA